MQDGLTNGLRNSLTSVIEFLPKLVGFLLILLIGLFVAKLIAKAVSKVLEKVGFERAVGHGGVKKALERSSMSASEIVSKLVYYALALFVLQLAFGVFGPNPISDLITAVIAFLPKVIVAVIIVVVAAAIAAAVKTLIEGAMGGLSYGKIVANIASVFILFLGVTAALNQIEVATTVTTPVLIMILATIAGVIIVGAGGGLIRPMQARWEKALTTAEAEAPKVKEQARNAPPVTDQARQAKAAAEQAYNQADRPAQGGNGQTPQTGQSGSTGAYRL